MNKRIALMWLSTRKGIPVNQSHYPFLNGAIPASEATFAAAIYGVLPEPRARIGIYRFSREDGDFICRYALDYGIVNGQISSSQSGGGRHPIIDADKPLANWLIPLVISNSFEPGTYQWKDDPPVDIELVDQDDKRTIEGLAKLTRDRVFFAAQRSYDAKKDMVSSMLVRRSPDSSFPRHRFVSVFSEMADGLSPCNIPPEEYRSIILSAAYEAFGFSGTSQKTIRFSIQSTMKIVDEMFRNKMTKSQIKDHLFLGIKSIQSSCHQLADEIASNKKDAVARRQKVDLMIDLMTRYISSRNGSGILCFKTESEKVQRSEQTPIQTFVRPDKQVVVSEVSTKDFVFPRTMPEILSWTQ